MADKNFFKQIEKGASNAYKKSGLRDIYNKNKSLILTAGLNPVFELGGLMKDQKRNQKAKAQEAQEAQQEQKNEANQNLDNYLDTIVGRTPEGGQRPPGVPIPVPSGNPQQNPGIIPGLPNITPDQIQATGGIVGGPGQASSDVNRLMAEAELQRQMQTTAAEGFKTDRASMLQDYANLISQQQNRLLDENAPALYEDLNTRGLLRSSELGNAMARERSKAAAVLGEQVGLQGLNDRQTAINEASGINNQYYQGRYGAIQRGMSLEDFVRQTEAAKLLGHAVAPVSPSQPSAKGAGAMQGAIGGATAGAAAGGPYGAMIGAGAGLVGGGQLASK